MGERQQVRLLSGRPRNVWILATTRARTSRFGLRAAAALYRFRESLFLLPGLLVLAGVALAELTAAADRALGAAAPLTL